MVIQYGLDVGTRTFYEKELKRQTKNQIEVLAGTTY